VVSVASRGSLASAIAICAVSTGCADQDSCILQWLHGCMAIAWGVWSDAVSREDWSAQMP
jgi:hypothetical protein